MYDVVNDILFGSYFFLLFDVEIEFLRIESVMILWMVLYYWKFCEGIKVDELIDDFKNFDMKFYFRKIVGRKWDVYLIVLSENISYFFLVKKRSFLIFDSNWFVKELIYKNISNWSKREIIFFIFVCYYVWIFLCCLVWELDYFKLLYGYFEFFIF